MSTTSPTPAPLRYKRDKLTGCYNARFTATRTEPLVPNLPDLGNFDYTDILTVRVTPVDEWDDTKGRTVRWGWRVILFANGVVIADSGRSDEFGTMAHAKAYAARLLETPEAQIKALETMADPTSFPAWAKIKVHHGACMAAMDDFYGTVADRLAEVAS